MLNDPLELNVTGSGRERGLQHGREYPELIKGCFKRFCDFEGAAQKDIDDVLQRIEDGLNSRFPQVLDEIRGIADGSELGYEQIMQLNFCEEIWNKTVGWCTGICLTDSPDGPLVGKTGDVGEGDEKFHIVQRVDDGQGYRFLRGTFVGTVWTAAGINEAGLAFAGSGVKPKAWGREGLPGQAVVEACLQRCATVQEAIELVSGLAVIGTAKNMMFADTSGKAAVVEKCPVRQATRYPEDRVIFQTNHCVSKGMEDLVVDDQEWLENSRSRYEVLSRTAKNMPRTRLAMEDLLSLHSETASICQHGGAGGRFHTMAAYVLVPVRQEMWLTPGPPCRNEFIPFRV